MSVATNPRALGLFSLCLGILGTTGIGRAFADRAPEIALATVPTHFFCGDEAPESAAALRLYAAHMTWTAALVLEGTAAVVAVGSALFVLWSVSRTSGLNGRWEWYALIMIGAAAVAADAWQAHDLARPGAPHRALLSDLLSTLPDACLSVRVLASRARLTGEPAAIGLGVAMAASVAFGREPVPSELASRLKWLNQLLYVASALFVTGIMMSRANFVWVLAHWDVAADGEISNAIKAVVTGGVVESGVGYSAILAVFFLPARLQLARLVSMLAARESAVGGKARRTWLRENELQGSWQKDARQILALLAPVLSAPIFDAIAKS
ncbi:MAG TPA: hypothetical protein VGI39_34025 [Polyangiaceae bacterium]|jgi:hypothetical protein